MISTASGDAQKLSYTSDNGYGGGPSIGVVVLSTDETLEPEFRQISSDPVASFYHSRIPFDPVVTKETLARMEAELPASLALFTRQINFGAIGYGCTSGATIIGPDRIASIVQSVFPKAAVTDPVRAVVAACKHLGVSRLGMLTPYSLEVSAAMQALLETYGLTISSFATFDEKKDHKVARISEQSVYEAMLAVGKSDCDIVFASCTSLRCFGVIEQAEQVLGKPVISSNSAFAWHLHQLAGVVNRVNGPGRLFDPQTGE